MAEISPFEAASATLHALDPLERTIVELVSMFHEGIPRTDVGRALASLRRGTDPRPPSSAELLAILEALTKQGLLEGEARWTAPPAIAHVAALSLAREKRLEHVAAAVRTARPLRMRYGTTIEAWPQAVRELRIELYAQRWDEAWALYEGPARWAFGFIGRPFDATWIASLRADIRGRALMEIIDAAFRALEPSDEALAMLERERSWTDGGHHQIVEQTLMRGRPFEQAERLLATRSSLQVHVGRAWILALRGEWDAAIAAYEIALSAFLKTCGKSARFFPDSGGTFFPIALLASGRPAAIERARVLSEGAQKPGVSGLPRAYGAFSKVADVLENRAEAEDVAFIHAELERLHPLELLHASAALVWVGAKLPKEVSSALRDRTERAEAAGLRWLSSQYAGVLLRAGHRDEGGKLAALRARLEGVCLAEAARPPERWRSGLEALASVVSKERPVRRASTAPERDQRLIWVMSEEHEWLELAPREQKRSKGAWSKGRPVALKRLYEDAAGMEWLSTEDRLACAAIVEHVSHGRYRDVSYHLDTVSAFRALNGQPNVLAEVAGELVPVEVRERSPRLRIEAVDTGFHARLDPAPQSQEQDVSLRRAGPATVEIVTFTPAHHGIAKALGRKGLALPRDAESELRAVLEALSSVVGIDADLAPAQGDAELGDADTEPRFVLRPLGEGISIELVVRPLGPEGPSVRPGEGGSSLFGEAAGRRMRVARDLAEEARRAGELLARVPALASAECTKAGWALTDRDTALEALLDLRSAGATLEWPEGETLRVSAPVSIEQLVVSLRGASDRFELEGALSLPEGDPLELSTLLDYLAASPGRFLRMQGDGAFLALTAELRRRLDELRALSVPGAKLRFHRLLVPRVDELLEAARVRADAAWKRQCTRLIAVGDEPEIPSTLRAELRPYQLDGVHWLARLARWGAGACLADDMGLGKTVQTIALLLMRAPEGPSIVVAPTSVVPSFCDELARFAPTLRVRLYAGEDRAEELDSLGPFDIVVTSYALLQQDIEALAPLRFVVAVLDEAQQIKNAETLRARAAFRLVADQRIVTTGTPIENRLDDLWSIFRFLNPGLLGSAKDFDARFVRPIVRERERHAQERLKRLVSPFLLRRTKTSVLEELPSRTEITLRVELNDEELALYEVLRDEALDAIEELEPDARRMHIFAALTKLRRAASNARLVLANEKLPSAKLEAFGDLLDDLLPNRHKLLCFSQFVDHLAIVRELLEERGVSYQYLDGATPMAKRKAAVDAFQAGESEVFLISLKAGGFGLNLTAADYVVHLDPWWNPAVEDQASDRAHRIGQTRPVTIYRLVARNTIEERIVELHGRKRALAASVLDGSDVAARISEEELIELMRE